MFGHSVRLNFNKKEDFHATYYTSIMSLFIRFLITIYVVITVKKMVLKESDLNSTSILPIKLIDEGPVDYLTSGMKLFHVISKQGGRPGEGNSLEIGNQNLTKFLTISYEYAVYRSGTVTQDIKIPAKACTAEDLELSEVEATELFDAWANSTLVCPSFVELDTLNIEGDTASVDSKNLHFKVEKNV